MATIKPFGGDPLKRRVARGIRHQFGITTRPEAKGNRVCWPRDFTKSPKTCWEWANTFFLMDINGMF